MADKSKRKRKIAIEETLIVAAIMIAGLALQFFSGPFDKRFLSFPVNIIFLALLLLIFTMRRGTTVLKRMASGSMSVLLLVAITLAALWMGLVKDNRVQISWPFVLLYLLILINLTASIAMRVKRVSTKNLPFLLSHLGLFILLFAAGPGSADKSRYFMTVTEGGVEWRGEPSGKSDKKVVELPIAIELIDFSMEEYPPKLGIVNKITGVSLPLDKPLFFESKIGAESTIENWNLRVDSIVDRVRFAPSAYVVATNQITNQKEEGWVSCGNHFQHYRILDLVDDFCVAMTFPEPKSYKSQVKVYTPKGDLKEGDILVNSPMTVGNWRIYQFSYDTHMGPESQISIFELVYDPWVIPAYIGLILMLLGAVTLLWKGGER